ncbi:LolA family protein [Primorskyibacter sp. S187A]|uniref:LolA family protein n=1 Tax=Primorskyibacter sp. S187A TaxID=3415130 RepID=UPI003C7A9763
MRMIAAALALTLAASPALAEKLSLGAISQYLNQLQSTKGAFTQINADGSISTGEIAIKRPGRARFDYNPPERALVIVGGGSVAIFDQKTGATPEQYPIGRTPLKIILQRNVNLGASGIVVGHTFDGTSTIVTAQDPANPEFGTIEMVFTANPVELRQWIIRDEGGQPTTVILGEMDTSARLPNGLFNIQAEIAKLRN